MTSARIAPNLVIPPGLGIPRLMSASVLGRSWVQWCEFGVRMSADLAQLDGVLTAEADTIAMECNGWMGYMSDKEILSAADS